MSSEYLERLKIHFTLAYDMVEKLIDYCPNQLWDQKHGGFVFWQQILHALTGNKFWTRQIGGDFAEPFADRKVYPELEQNPEGKISKAELKALAFEVRNQNEQFFSQKDDAWLLEKNPLYNKITNFDVAIGQIRHLQYHAGHCDSILREHKHQAVEWVDFFG